MSNTIDYTEPLEEIAVAIESLARAIRSLGINNADTPLGALELLSLEIKNGSERISNAIETGDQL